MTTIGVFGVVAILTLANPVMAEVPRPPAAKEVPPPRSPAKTVQVGPENIESVFAGSADWPDNTVVQLAPGVYKDIRIRVLKKGPVWVVSSKPNAAQFRGNFHVEIDQDHTYQGIDFADFDRMWNDRINGRRLEQPAERAFLQHAIAFVGPRGRMERCRFHGELQGSAGGYGPIAVAGPDCVMNRNLFDRVHGHIIQRMGTECLRFLFSHNHVRRTTGAWFINLQVQGFKKWAAEGVEGSEYYTKWNWHLFANLFEDIENLQFLDWKSAYSRFTDNVVRTRGKDSQMYSRCGGGNIFERNYVEHLSPQRPIDTPRHGQLLVGGPEVFRDQIYVNVMFGNAFSLFEARMTRPTAEETLEQGPEGNGHPKSFANVIQNVTVDMAGARPVHFEAVVGMSHWQLPHPIAPFPNKDVAAFYTAPGKPYTPLPSENKAINVCAFLGGKYLWQKEDVPPDALAYKNCHVDKARGAPPPGVTAGDVDRRTKVIPIHSPYSGEKVYDLEVPYSGKGYGADPKVVFREWTTGAGVFERAADRTWSAEGGLRLTGRALVAVPKKDFTVLLTWRFLDQDGQGTGRKDVKHGGVGIMGSGACALLRPCDREGLALHVRDQHDLVVHDDAEVAAGRKSDGRLHRQGEVVVVDGGVERRQSAVCKSFVSHRDSSVPQGRERKAEGALGKSPARPMARESPVTR